VHPERASPYANSTFGHSPVAVKSRIGSCAGMDNCSLAVVSKAARFQARVPCRLDDEVAPPRPGLFRSAAKILSRFVNLVGLHPKWRDVARFGYILDGAIWRDTPHSLDLDFMVCLLCYFESKRSMDHGMDCPSARRDRPQLRNQFVRQR
jgi:hypothetical protein